MKNVKRIPTKLAPEKIQNVGPIEIASAIGRKLNVIMNANIQLKKPINGLTNVDNSFEYISPINKFMIRMLTNQYIKCLITNHQPNDRSIANSKGDQEKTQ